MVEQAKTGQLQIRVSESEKRAIQKAASRANMDMSSYVLSRVLSNPCIRFQELTQALPTEERFALAELNSFLSSLTAGELRDAVSMAPGSSLPRFSANYLAAMVELACVRRGVVVPTWVMAVEPLPEPVFASSLLSVRLHLLMASPPSFRRRNLFIDASLGDRV